MLHFVYPSFILPTATSIRTRINGDTFLGGSNFGFTKVDDSDIFVNNQKYLFNKYLSKIGIVVGEYHKCTGNRMSITEVGHRPLFPTLSKIEIHKTQIIYNEMKLFYTSGPKLLDAKYM